MTAPALRAGAGSDSEPKHIDRLRTPTTGRARIAMVLAGTVAAGLGLFIYVTERDLSRSSLIPNAWQLAPHHLFGTAADWLPSFLHSLAFSVFTVAALWPCRRRVVIASCAVWAAVNVLFELGQHPAIQAPLASIIRRVTNGSSAGNLLAGYFANGVFDRADIAAAIAGAACAAASMLLVLDHAMRRQDRHD